MDSTADKSGGRRHPVTVRTAKVCYTHSKEDSYTHVAATWASNADPIFTSSITDILSCRLGTRRREQGALPVVDVKSNAMKGCPSATIAADYNSVALTRDDQIFPSRKSRVGGMQHTARRHLLPRWKALSCSRSTLLSMTRWQ